MSGCRPRFPRATRLPPTGRCPSRALAELGSRPFGFYVHVPFCTVRCGYCDFNTYTAAELGDQPGASRATYAEAAIAEIRLARRGARRPRPARSTPSSSAAVRRPCSAPATSPSVLAAIAAEFGLAPGRRGDHRGQPRQRRGVGPRGAARGGLHPDELRDAVGRRPRARTPSTAPTTRCGSRPSSSGRARPASTRSASTSSTAPRGSRWRTGRPRSRRPSAVTRTTSRRTP